MRNKIVSIAQKEVGYKEQGTNQTKYGQWYGMQDEWCAMFVGWCANEIGVLDSLIPKMAYVPSMVNWFKEKGQYKARGVYPTVGDVIFFDYNHNGTSDHVGLVEKCENGIVTTIEGNKNNMVQRCTYRVNSNDILGYGVPEYAENENNESGESEMKRYKNGTTKEIVYQTTECTKEIGELNPYEECDCLGIVNGLAVVCYKIDGSAIGEKKVGFVKWLDGIQ